MGKMEKNAVLQDDILRYKKNKFAANFALLALVFNVLYFTLLYTIHNSDIYKIMLGGSVILNLLVLLAGFYASEGIKGYNKKFSIVLFVLAGVQIARIFIYPTLGMANNWLVGNRYLGIEMTNAANGVVMIVYLAASAACFVLSGVYGFIIAQRLTTYQKKLDNGEVSVEETLKELDEKDAAAAQAVVEVKDEVAEAKPEEAATPEAVAEPVKEVAPAEDVKPVEETKPAEEVKPVKEAKPAATAKKKKNVATESKADVKDTSSEEGNNG